MAQVSEIGQLRREAEGLIGEAERKGATHFGADEATHAVPLADGIRARLVRRLMIGRSVSARIAGADGEYVIDLAMVARVRAARG